MSIVGETMCGVFENLLYSFFDCSINIKIKVHFEVLCPSQTSLVNLSRNTLCLYVWINPYAPLTIFSSPFSTLFLPRRLTLWVMSAGSLALLLFPGRQDSGGMG